ncbi:MAG: hypothetical protein LW870_21205 [Pirellula sp.]|nr:hypothetical protein [Pirellula sp.]
MKIEPQTRRLLCGTGAEKAMRFLTSVVLIASLCGLGVLYWTTSSQPKNFMSLIIRESDTEESRAVAIDTWRTQYIPTNTQPFLGNRSPLVRYKLDAQLASLPASERGWMFAEDPQEKPATFKKRLYDLNVGIERFSRDYWSRVWFTMEFLVLVAVASILNLIFPRILPSLILLVSAGVPTFIHLEVWSRGGDEGASPFWFLPSLVIIIVIGGLAIYRWWVAPAPAEVTQNWNKLWLGLLLTSIGVGAFIALFLWGGRVRTNGLAGIGLSFGWGVYLVVVHGSKLIRSLFSKSHSSRQSNSGQIVEI